MAQEKKYEPYELLNRHFRLFVDSEKKNNNIPIGLITQIYRLYDENYQLLRFELNDWEYGDNVLITIYSNRDISRMDTGKSDKTLDEYFCNLYPCKFIETRDIGTADTDEIRVIELIFSKKDWENIPRLTKTEYKNIIKHAKHAFELYFNSTMTRLTV